MKLYSGIDLHSSNSYLAIIDETGKHVFKEKSPNDMAAIARAFEPYRNWLDGIVVESTYNWYWLVDGLMAEEYAVHLANPSAIQKYSGMKQKPRRGQPLT
ncbi:MAG: transposase [Desulfuromonadaceae bacterium]|nr:transposase [Desulfuromonadaceae bacterium]